MKLQVYKCLFAGFLYKCLGTKEVIGNNETMNVLKVTTEIELTLDIHLYVVKNYGEHKVWFYITLLVQYNFFDHPLCQG